VMDRVGIDAGGIAEWTDMNALLYSIVTTLPKLDVISVNTP
jgi:hypothetical protein